MRWFVVASCWCFGWVGVVGAVDMPPASPIRAVVDTYHGEEVVDSYRWLEDWQQPEVQEWTARQNEYARTYLDALPGTAAIRERVTAIMSAPIVRYGSVIHRGGRFFAMKTVPPSEQPVLVVLDSLDDLTTERVLFDPTAAGGDASIAVDWFEPSPDGKQIAISVSRGGNEVGDVWVYDVDSSQRVGEVIPRVNSGTAGGDLAWAADGKGFYYTRHPQPGERPAADLGFYQQVYFHILGTDVAQDRYELGQGFPRIAEIELETHQTSGRVIATVQNGDGGEFAHYLREPAGTWKQFSRFTDATIQATFASDGDLLLVTRLNAPRGRIMKLKVSEIDQGIMTELIPEGKGTIVTSFYHHPPTVVSIKDRIFVVYQTGGPSEIQMFRADGKPLDSPSLLPVSAVDDLCAVGDEALVYRNESYLVPATYFLLDVATGEVRKTGLPNGAGEELAKVNVVREFAKSKDGTLIPVNIVFSSDIKLDGSTPALLTGYGGYGISQTPRHIGARRVLLEHGMILAVANLRGGSEYGGPWHEQGRLVHKQNVFDDFAAVAEHLVARGYTSPQKLAILGGSNGGLLMGATMTQHPELARVVVAQVGIYDMLRVELSANGAFNVPEYGSVKDLQQYRALRAYSPLHNVKDNTRYPSTMLLTGVNDPRVDPMQSRKMAARLQAANTGETPILLRTSANTGHGGDTPLSARIEETVDIFGFVLHELGITSSN